MRGPNVRLAASTLIVVCISLAACGRSTPESVTVPATPQPIEVPVTVEVTRVVARQIVVDATPTPPQPCAPATLDQAKNVVIGAILPLSTPGAMLAGFSMQTALSIAVSEINDAGGIKGKPMRLVTYDSAGMADQGEMYAQRLITQDCAVAIVGIYHSDVGLAVAKIAHSFGIPLIVTGAIADEITATRFPEVFRISPTRSMLAQMPAKWLAEVGDYNKDGQLYVVVVADNNARSSALLGDLEQSLTHFAIKHDIVPVDLPSTDFSPVIARIVTMEKIPDAVFLLVNGSAALTLQSQLSAAGLGPQKATLIVTGKAALDSQSFWQIVPNGVGTIVMHLGPWPPTSTPLGDDFAVKYSQFFDRWPENYSFTSYDALRLVADSIQRAPSLAGRDIIAALEESNFQSAGGSYTFPYGSHNPPSGEAVPDFMWHQWPDVQTLYLRYSQPEQPAAQMQVLWPKLYHNADEPTIP